MFTTPQGCHDDIKYALSNAIKEYEVVFPVTGEPGYECAL